MTNNGWYMYKKDLALKDQQQLIWKKKNDKKQKKKKTKPPIKPNQPKNLF